MFTIEGILIKHFRKAAIITDSAHHSLKGLLRKLDFLSKIGRYQKLISKFAPCNDKNNLLGFILEVTFAYNFESKGKPLEYEVRQTNDLTSVDFLRVMNENLNLYLELGLVQQREYITQIINEQITQIIKYKKMDSYGYGLLLNESDQQKEIIRLQSIMLSKCQDKYGNPIKFFKISKGYYNIIVVDVSDLLLGAIDKWDCLLATYGDPAVPEPCRRSIFGIFQNDKPSYLPYIHELSKKFSHIRSTIHGVLFIRRKPKNDPLNFQIEHCFIPNSNLLKEEEISSIREELNYALLSWNQ